MKNGKNGKDGVGKKDKNEIRYRVLSKEEFNAIFGSSSGNDYKELKEVLANEKKNGSECIVLTFEELAEIVGCKATSGAARNVQQYVKQNMKDLVKTVKVSGKAGIIGFLLK